ncbi:MAG TPA: spermidine/putrescine ABC transporter substrate-binding protein [Solirubrobacterales bacterium]|nr:spermidine/putrescine ABC transporter substrate-binding protein [Solirubrobacterales bacterium]
MRIRDSRLVVALATFVLALGLAACGDDGGLEGGGGNDGATETAEAGPVEGSLTISNWPLYIDPGENGTIADFEEKTGVSVKYIEDVNDNVEFFGKLRPQLAQGSSGGRSIFVVTDWMASKMNELGYLQNLDKSALPNVEANLRGDLQDPPFDPGRQYSVPWQSGMTGIVVRKDLAPDVRSVNDLFDPKYKGKVTFLTEMRDTVPLVMKAEGVDVDGATEEDWLKAVDKLKEAVDSGQIRRFTGNDYARDLTKGDVVAAIGWSGDAVQLQADNPNIEWRMPTEGCIIWSDNMVIPIGAPNEAAALEFIDYVYDPKVQADIAAYVNYVTPVDGVKEALEKEEPELTKNQLIFPSDSFTKDCSIQPTLSGEEETKVTEAFESLLTG